MVMMKIMYSLTLHGQGKKQENTCVNEVMDISYMTGLLHAC